jgi:phage RecT family recombinase
MPDQFLTLLEQKRSLIEQALGGDEAHQRRFIALAVNAITKNHDFDPCTAESKVQCILDAATTELELGTPDRLAWLIRYKLVLQFQVGYVGMIKRLKEAGAAADIYADIIYANDEIRIDGAARKLQHYYGTLNKRGEMVGAYALATLANGIVTWEILELSDIDAIKNAARRQQGPNMSPAWREFEPEMVKKSAIRRLAKRLPGDVSKQDKVTRLRAVLEADNRNFDYETTKVTVADTSLDDIADTIAANEPVPKEDPYIDLEQQNMVEAQIVNGGWTAREIPNVLKLHAGVNSTDQIKVSQLMDVLKSVTEAAENKRRQAGKTAKEGNP